MYLSEGYLSEEELDEIFPREERLEEGAVAIIECVQPIPCNPCEEACPRHAIQQFEKMTDNPVIDLAKCNGCGLCIGSCPGLAIYVLDYHYSDQSSLLKLPYEMLPVPEADDTVELVDRSGKIVGQGRIVKVQTLKHNPKTRIVWVEIPKKLYKSARSIKVAIK